MISRGGGATVVVEAVETVTATISGVYGTWADAVIALDGDTSGEVDLGASFHHLQIYIPTIDAADVGFEVAETSGGDFYPLGIGTAVIQCGTGNCKTTVLLGGHQFIKVTTSGPQTAERTFRVRGSNV